MAIDNITSGGTPVFGIVGTGRNIKFNDHDDLHTASNDKYDTVTNLAGDKRNGQNDTQRYFDPKAVYVSV